MAQRGSTQAALGRTMEAERLQEAEAALERHQQLIAGQERTWKGTIREECGYFWNEAGFVRPAGLCYPVAIGLHCTTRRRERKVNYRTTGSSSQAPIHKGLRLPWLVLFGVGETRCIMVTRSYWVPAFHTFSS